MIAIISFQINIISGNSLNRIVYVYWLILFDDRDEAMKKIEELCMDQPASGNMPFF